MEDECIMSKVLALNGDNNVGKSTTIYELIKLFPKDCVKEVNSYRLYKNNPRKYPEVSVVVNYKGKTICITTKGDDPKCVLKEIKAFKENGYNPYKCDLFVCASRCSGDLVKHLLKNFDKKVFVTKEDVKVISKRDSACREKAKELFKEVLYLIK